MLKYLAKRIGRSILTLFIIVTLVFCLLRLMPVEGYFANYEKMTEVQIQAGLQSMGLLDPLPVQIFRFWKNALHGDLGVSHIYKVNASVTGILAKKLPISVQMGVYAMLLSLIIGIPMGLSNVLINIPIILFSYKVLGKSFLLPGRQGASFCLKIHNPQMGQDILGLAFHGPAGQGIYLLRSLNQLALHLLRGIPSLAFGQG